MTDRELMQQALEAFEYHVETAEVEDKRIEAAIYALRTVLAQPEQEPVAWYDKHGMVTHDPFEGIRPLYTTPPAAQPFWDLFDENQRLRAELKFNTTPPQQWVGLTKEEAKEISMANRPYVIDMIAALEARLKEKNT